MAASMLSGLLVAAAALAAPPEEIEAEASAAASETEEEPAADVVEEEGLHASETEEEETLPRCLRALQQGRSPARITVQDSNVVVEHSCSRWGVQPVPLRGVQVVDVAEEMEQSEDAISHLLFRYPDREPIYRSVQVGDILSDDARVVGMAPGIVLVDVGGVLAVATDGRQVGEWRMIYSSRFGVPVPSSGGGGGQVKRKPGQPQAKVAPQAKRLADPKRARKK